MAAGGRLSRVCRPNIGAVLERRIDGRIEEARQPLEQLYGHREDFETWFGKILEVVVARYADRSAELRELDLKRLADPDWFRRAEYVGYSCYVSRFGGTLEGAVERIPYLEELGIRYLHLLPILKSRRGPGGRGLCGR